MKYIISVLGIYWVERGEKGILYVLYCLINKYLFKIIVGCKNKVFFVNK